MCICLKTKEVRVMMYHGYGIHLNEFLKVYDVKRTACYSQEQSAQR
jgi:hypothetical protein